MIIIGAGITGLSIAWHLTKKNVPVIVFDQGLAGSETSSKAAGLITPTSEIRYGEEKLVEFFLNASRYYPKFIEEIEKSSGEKTQFNQNGSFLIAIDQDDEAELSRLHQYQKSLDCPVSEISIEDLIEKEPTLSRNCVKALHAPHEYCVNPISLISALKVAIVKNGGRIIENKKVDRIEIRQNRIESISVGKEEVKADQVILATGNGSMIDGFDLKIPLRPVKGQALEVKITQPYLQHAVRTIHRYPAYLVPHNDGRITIGATQEEMGFDQKITAGAQMDLIYAAWKILPAIYDGECVGSWVGHRPTTPDHIPILGPTSIKGLSVALGMYRHGIMLAPKVGEMLADLVLGKKNLDQFEMFGLGRFVSPVSSADGIWGTGPNPEGLAPGAAEPLIRGTVK